MWKGQAEYEAWVEAWRAEHPQPRMSKKKRWAIEHAAWIEMRRTEKAKARKAASAARKNHTTKEKEQDNVDARPTAR